MLYITYKFLQVMFAGFLVMCIPRRWYAQGEVEWFLVGFWIFTLTFSISCITWVVYGIVQLINMIIGMV
jgi:hypothetical protein